MNPEMLNALRDSYNKGVDIDSIYDSVLPPMQFVSEDAYACALEGCSAIMEAYGDLRMYEAEANSILIESASTMSEYDIGVLSSAIQEGVGMKIRHAYQQAIVALKGMISKLGMFITEKLGNSLVNSIRKSIKKNPEKLTSSIMMTFSMHSKGLKSANDLLETEDAVRTEDDYKKFEKELTNRLLSKMANDQLDRAFSGEENYEDRVDMKAFEKLCDNMNAEILRSGKIFKNIINDRKKLLNELQQAENNETDKDKLREIIKTTNIKIKSSGKILSAYGHSIGTIIGLAGGSIHVTNMANNKFIKETKKSDKNKK